MAHEMSYKVFTKEHDRVEHARDLKTRFFHDALDLDKIENWEKQKVSSRGGFTPLNISSEDDEIITLLIDCSGSMRGDAAMSQAFAVRAFGDAMTAAGRSFRVLGHTTNDWKGGQPRKEWLAGGRKQNPGRLNALLHVIFHDVGEDWQDNKDGLLLAVGQNGFLKENIDGDALQWAAEMAPTGKIVYLTDGAPIDDSTLSVNRDSYLQEHCNEVVEKLLVSGRELVTVLEVGHYDRDATPQHIEQMTQSFKAKYVEEAPLLSASTYTPDNILQAIATAAFTPYDDLKPQTTPTPGM